MSRTPAGRHPGVVLSGPESGADVHPAPLGLIDGTELVGEYQGRGCVQRSYLIRRVDGRMLEVSPLLHLVAGYLRDARDFDEIASRVTTELGRPVSAESIAYLVERKLAPLGIVSTYGDSGSRPTPRAPILTMTTRGGVLPSAAVRAVALLLRPLFLPPVVVVALLALVAADGWLLIHHDLWRATQSVMSRPGMLLVVVGLTLAAGVFHELGHATASYYGGAEPGTIGAGIYLMWPVFFNDMNDSYRLPRRDRLRADLGGVYFNAVFIMLLAALYATTRFTPLLVAIMVQHLVVAQQFVPFLRLDGYYIVSDLAGVPDLFGCIRPVLSRLVRRRPSVPALTDLTPRARTIVTVWALTTVAMLGCVSTLLVAGLPSLLAAAWEALRLHSRILVQSLGDLVPLQALASSIHIALLVIPLVGLSGVLLRILHACPRRGAQAAARAEDCGDGNGAAVRASQPAHLHTLQTGSEAHKASR